MQTFAFALDLVDEPGAVERYEALHRAVWREVEAALKAVGVEDLPIFRIGLRLVMVVRAGDEFDPARDFARYLEHNDRIPQWEALMQTVQKRVPEARPGEQWARMKEIYRLD